MSKFLSDYIYGKYVEARRAGYGSAFRLSVTTMAEIEQAVSDLHDIDKDKAIKAGLRSAGNYLSRQGKAKLKDRTYGSYTTKSGRLSSEGKKALASHNLFNSFVVRVKRRSLGALVGFNKRGRHSHLVDKGTGNRSHPITGTSGVMPANRFWSDTAEQEWSTASGIMKDAISRAVTRIMFRSNRY